MGHGHDGHPHMPSMDGGHQMPGMDHACAMNMAFNWDTENVCVLFDFWRINSPVSLVVSCLTVVALSVGYELVKFLIRHWEWFNIRGGYTVATRGSRNRSATGESGDSTPGWANEDDSEEVEENAHLATNRLSRESDTMVRVHGRTERQLVKTRRQKVRVTRAMAYSVQVFYSFMLMLIFMTYNGYLIVSVVVGTAIGHYLFGPDEVSGLRSMACH